MQDLLSPLLATLLQTLLIRWAAAAHTFVPLLLMHACIHATCSWMQLWVSASVDCVLQVDRYTPSPGDIKDVVSTKVVLHEHHAFPSLTYMVSLGLGMTGSSLLGPQCQLLNMSGIVHKKLAMTCATWIATQAEQATPDVPLPGLKQKGKEANAIGKAPGQSGPGATDQVSQALQTGLLFLARTVFTYADACNMPDCIIKSYDPQQYWEHLSM